MRSFRSALWIAKSNHSSKPLAIWKPTSSCAFFDLEDEGTAHLSSTASPLKSLSRFPELFPTRPYPCFTTQRWGPCPASARFGPPSSIKLRLFGLLFSITMNHVYWIKYSRSLGNIRFPCTQRDGTMATNHRRSFLSGFVPSGKTLS
ncbi:hypothetical protein FRB99_001281, partial [Tulasnella sp. 403]